MRQIFNSEDQTFLYYTLGKVQNRPYQGVKVEGLILEGS